VHYETPCILTLVSRLITFPVKNLGIINWSFTADKLMSKQQKNENCAQVECDIFPEIL